MTQEKQGTVVIEQSDGPGFLLMFPDGDVAWRATKRSAENRAKLWFREHLNAQIGIGEIEWRLS